MDNNVRTFTDRAVALTCWLVVGLCCAAANAQAYDAGFPRPVGLESNVRFWTYVFTQLGDSSGAVHDTRNLEIIYEVLHFDSEVRPRERGRRSEAAKRRYADILRRLASEPRDELDAEHLRVLNLWPRGTSDAELRAASSRLRYQRGLADTMLNGIIRAGAWEHEIAAILEEEGVPQELLALPLLEAAYDPWTYSSARAFGLWQFIPSTGRMFLRIDNVVDERMHLLEATRAAARLLKEYRSEARTWPLTLTAYNHGNGGVRRAVREVGTRDIAVIVEQYRGPSFGFASRNYYSSYLAALDVYFNAQQYFGPVRRDPPERVQYLTLTDAMRVNALSAELAVEPETLRRFNPALKDIVWEGRARVPAGYMLRVPDSL
ncbi:MAG: transglycosylase SLT domain-containing protein, partial [Gammaproteobacteria bacterium]